MKLAGRNIILGVTGGIAIYKSASLLRRLKGEEGAEVQVIMTASALKFMTPLIFETFSGKSVWTNLFSDSEMVGVRHVDISEWADALLICPATANIIGKAANGIADDLLSTVICDAGTKSLFAAAMESGMYNNPVVKENVKRLKDAGFGFIEPETGALASGAEGIGRLADEDTIIQALKNHLPSGALEDKKITVTAGPTREYIDPVRFISNPSSGKMGYALAEAARKAGADVTLSSGPVSLPEPAGVEVIRVTTVEEMKKALLERFETSDALLMAAAVGDYTPAEVYDQKIKKNGEDLTLILKRTDDILKGLKKLKKNKIVIGFSVETEKLTENSKSKLKEKGLDLIITNNPNENGAGFAHDTNKVSIIDSKGEIEELDLMSKQELSSIVINKLSILLNGS